jgi:thiamine kinase-like enzyme
VTTLDEVLERVQVWRSQNVRVSELSGGLTNTNHLVEAGDDRYVIRIPGASTELLAVDRKNERHNAAAAATTGISPRIVEVLEDLDVMVIEYVEGTTMSSESLRDREAIPRVAVSLRRLHAGPRFLKDFNMFRLTDFYLGVCAAHDVPIPEGFREHQHDVAAIEQALGARPLPTVPCHNDLLAENYIDDGAQLWIVDFEYSGNNDPTFELGDTAQECGFDGDLRARLCEAYFGQAAPQLLARMDLQAVMADVGWTLWAAIQATISSIEFDFWGWAEERWGRATTAFASEGFGRLLSNAAG